MALMWQVGKVFNRVKFDSAKCSRVTREQAAASQKVALRLNWAWEGRHYQDLLSHFMPPVDPDNRSSLCRHPSGQGSVAVRLYSLPPISPHLRITSSLRSPYPRVSWKMTRFMVRTRKMAMHKLP
jgi:hypothetical protein